MKSSKGRIYTFIRQHQSMTLATASAEGKPEAATIKYVVDGDNLLFNVTSTDYRKYKNLLANPEVACVITADHTTVQFEALTQEVQGPLALEIKSKMLEADPTFANYFTDKTRFFIIRPTWMRLQDYGKKPVEQVFYVPN